MRANEFINEKLEENKFFNRYLFPLAMATTGTAGLETAKHLDKPSSTGYELEVPTKQVPKMTSVEPKTTPKSAPIQPEPEPIKPLSTKDIIFKVASENGLRGDELAQFLAQCAHESANFSELEENLYYSRRGLRTRFPKLFPNEQLAAAYENKPKLIANYIYANKNGNGNESSGDGYRYRGRGFIHLTGRANYQRVGQIGRAHV